MIKKNIALQDLAEAVITANWLMGDFRGMLSGQNIAPALSTVLLAGQDYALATGEELPPAHIVNEATAARIKYLREAMLYPCAAAGSYRREAIRDGVDPEAYIASKRLKFDSREHCVQFYEQAKSQAQADDEAEAQRNPAQALAN